MKTKTILLLFLLLFTAFCKASPDQVPIAKPNVLFIAVDDLRPMLGSYGEVDVHTPNLDRLAAAGTLFEQAYCNVPVCGASRASLLTGLRPHRTRFLSFDTRAEKDAAGTLSLPAHFKNNGYHTKSLGKIFHHADDMEESWSEKPWPSSHTSKGQPNYGRHYLTKNNQQLETIPGKRGHPYESAEVADSAYFDGMMTQKAKALLKSFTKSKDPFFLALGYHKPHLPFNAPKKYFDRYPLEKVTTAANPYWPKGAPGEGWYGTGELRNYTGVPTDGPIPDTLARKLRQAYKACITYVDALIGEVLTTLEETGLDKNTIVIVWGDHGYLLGEHQLWCKHITFNKALHVPLIIRAPGYQRMQRVKGLAEYVDLYPTLCDLAGIVKPSHLAGTSLESLMKNPKSNGKQYVICRYGNLEAIKTDRYLFSHWIDSTGKVTDRMLFDHRKDPEENVNVAAHKEYRSTVEKLSKTLLVYMKE